MIHSQLINRKLQQPEERMASSSISDKGARGDCGCNATILKLRIINLTSENHNLRKKQGDLQELLEKSKGFQLGFRNAVNVIKQLLNKTAEQDDKLSSQLLKPQELPLSSKQSNINSNILARNTKGSQAQTLVESVQTTLNPKGSVHTKIQEQGQKYKLEEYQLLRQLGQGQSRETVRSLEASMGSRESLHQLQRKREEEVFNKEELFALREEYEEEKQHLQSMCNMKVKLLTQEIEELKKQNWELLAQIKRGDLSQGHRPDNEEFDTPEEGRQTAYFRNIQAISEQQFEESLEVSERDHSVVSVTLRKNQKNSRSVSSQNWTEAAEQMRIVKKTLERLQQMLKNGSEQVIKVLNTFYQLRKISKKVKVIGIQQYSALLQADKKRAVETNRCLSLQKETKKLKEMIKQLI